MAILEPLYVEVLDKERTLQGLFQLTKDFTHEDSVHGQITVPEGYVTDFASIPLPVRWLIPQAGHSAKAATLHDYLLARSPTPKIATGVFNRALREFGTGPIRRVLMVAFVAVWTFPALYIMRQENG